MTDVPSRVFRAQTPYLKAPYFYENLGITDSLVGLCDPHRHRLHRAVINPLFSKQALDKQAPVIGQIVEHAAEIMRQRHKKGKHVDIQKLYRCITVRAFVLPDEKVTRQDREQNGLPPYT